MPRLKHFGLLAVAVYSIGAMQSWAQIEEPRFRPGDLMTMKLESAQSLLKGIVVEDFELIAREAQRLNLLSHDVGWNILQTKQYVRFSKDFQHATDQIRAAAEKQNLDGAAIGYLKLTMSCVDCHRHVRSVAK